MKLIVGLGNPGKEYVNTRHNIGYMIVDHYLKDVLWKENSYGFFYKTIIKDEDVMFVKPTTFMNLSGNAVAYFMNYYKIDKSDVFVIQDDLDLSFGHIRLKNNSGSGGHNGIKSIIECMKTQDFIRLKVGISKPENNDVIDYVLHKFSKSELDELSNTFNTTDKIIDDIIKDNSIQNLMNQYN